MAGKSVMTGFAFSLATLCADVHNSGTSLIAAMAIFFKAPQRAPSFWAFSWSEVERR